MTLAIAAILFGLECEIHIGVVDVAKQHPNVVWIEILDTRMVSVISGGQILKKAIDSAFSVFVAGYAGTFFATGSVVGPDLYPSTVRDFQSIIGRGAHRQVLEKEDRLPDALVATVGGGSNVLGLLAAFLEDEPAKTFGVEPVGHDPEVPGQHIATTTFGALGTLHGMYTLLLQDKDGNPVEVHSIVLRLNYPGASPQYVFLRGAGRVEYVTASDDEIIATFRLPCHTKDIIPALESSYALAYAIRLASTVSSDKMIVVNLSGRGDKDVDYVAEYLAR